MTIQYYLFISDSKVGMLLPQFTPTRRKTGKLLVELGVNLSLLNAKVSVECNADSGRIARLEGVAKKLLASGELGTVEAPKKFFYGIMPMSWGQFLDTSLVWFGGHQCDVVVGLGGSGKHVIGGSNSSDDAKTSRSLMPWLLKGLAAEPDIGKLLELGHSSNESVLRAVQMANAATPGPEQNVEFIAKRLLDGEVDGKKVVLGSPLYVAAVD